MAVALSGALLAQPSRAAEPTAAATAVAAAAEASGEEAVVTAPVRPNLFGTVVIPGPLGRWAGPLQRVMTEPGTHPVLAGFIAPARGLSRTGQIAYLQAAVDKRIGWRSDTTQYGARTYWATAAQTLAAGLGDDDDRAILKYQALRALGVPASEVYLMMGRDRTRGDYMLVAVRASGRWWLLEEQGDRPVAADSRTGFEPAASFGAGRAWIHGRPRVARPLTLAASAVASAGRVIP